jgi:hypothetical protein
MPPSRHLDWPAYLLAHGMTARQETALQTRLREG